MAVSTTPSGASSPISSSRARSRWLAAERGLQLTAVEALEALALVADAVQDATQAARFAGAARSFRERTGFRWITPALREPLACLASRGTPIADELLPSLDEAVALARRGRGERRRPATGWDSLTPAESAVIELVATGVTNREIAQRLFVSVATVKTHLIHIYAKLDVRSRAELAATATARSHAAQTPERRRG
jgi:DNA-binding NarL/FixJ family response regulator